MTVTAYLISSDVVTQPWVSSHAFDLALIGLMFGMFGAVSLCVAAEKLIQVARRNAVADIGARLLTACKNDSTTVDLVIANAEIGNDLLDAEMRVGIMSDFRDRQAQFNAACQDEPTCGGRWLDVQ